MIKAAHGLDTNFITLLKSLKEIAHVPLYFRVLDLQRKCGQARLAGAVSRGFGQSMASL